MVDVVRVADLRRLVVVMFVVIVTGLWCLLVVVVVVVADLRRLKEGEFRRLWNVVDNS